MRRISEHFEDIPRNVWLLVTAQAFGSCGTIMVILTGGILGAMHAPEEALATMPITAVIIGVAVSTVPAAMLMRWVGRRAGFITGAALALAGSGVGAYAIIIQDFWLFTAAMVPIGTNQAFIQQYRFAAVESVPSAIAPRAVSTVLLGSIVAAYLGPEVAVRARDLFPDAAYAGSFLGLIVCYLLAIAALSQLRLSRPSDSRSTAEPTRALSTILLQPRSLAAVAGAAIGFGVMTLLMTATPISMHVHRHFTMPDTASVIQAHVLAMFLPSLFTGALVVRFGEYRMMAAGIGFNVLCVATAMHGDSLPHFALALTALGVGWNLLFIASTTLLTKCYRPHERFAVQAANDFTVFGFQAAASLGAGVLVHLVGWEYLAATAALPLLAFTGLLVFVAAAGRRQPA